MPGFLTPVIRLIPNGHINTTQTWSTGLSMSLQLTNLDLTQAQLDGVVSDVLPAFATWWTAVKPFCSGLTQYDGLRAYFYPESGTKALLSAVTQIAPVVGTGTLALPSYVSCVVTLRTATPGRRGRGRNYLPTNAMQATNAHQFTLANITAVCNAHATLLTSLNALNLNGRGIQAHSQVVNSSSNVGTSFPVTRVTADSLPDSQHRREDKFLPSSVISANV